MADNNCSNVIESLMKNMDSVVGSKTVVGEPVIIGDATIIPLVDVSFGVGAGATSLDKRNAGAGGAHTKVTPNAVLVLQNGHAKLLSVKNQDTLAKAIDMIPEVIDKVKAILDGNIKNDEAVDAAFPDRKEE